MLPDVIIAKFGTTFIQIKTISHQKGLYIAYLISLSDVENSQVSQRTVPMSHCYNQGQKDRGFESSIGLRGGMLSGEGGDSITGIDNEDEELQQDRIQGRVVVIIFYRGGKSGRKGQHCSIPLWYAVSCDHNP